ncbi:MAG: hypothetical protein HY651_09310 [Acidobacteria bacterium]|nr:hypothetical protein [Acidobacteriota bacterium]
MQIEPGDFVKVIFRNEQSGEAERMWVKVERADDAARIVFGALDNEPLVNPDLHRGMQLAVSYDNICEHMKDSSFNQ